ncbi:hypothetical protein [Francisella sp. LA112445]|jgi:5-carboxymethyl-2-hydroxymuconate isomerase|uniref:hypothetical protein n=1 Tax=Francisella sp. LA112445 TaxID=1395624 RepID=UPI001788ADC5|nr:hypothetical protein [Francisella sp. LA112445]QIW10514.1 hypothetical protein FIP56_07315 [Francisella sp. LA112445]
MPHIILEIPQEFNIGLAKQAIDISQEYLTKELPTKLESFKSRVYRYEYCSVAGSNEKELIHIKIKVLAGRKQEHLNTLSANLKSKILDMLGECINMDKYTVTLEIVELPAAYAR